jgi:hypothetical protein
VEAAGADRLATHAAHETLFAMKVLSVADAEKQLDSVCEQALAGEVIRLQLANGALVELPPIRGIPRIGAISPSELAETYNDREWASFENHCGKSSD